GWEAGVLPERVSAFVLLKDDERRLLDALPLQSEQSGLHEAGADSAIPELGQNGGVVEKAPPPVVPRQDSAHNAPVQLRHKAGGGISAQIPFDSLPAVVCGVEPHTRRGEPEGKHLVVILRLHETNPYTGHQHPSLRQKTACFRFFPGMCPSSFIPPGMVCRPGRSSWCTRPTPPAEGKCRRPVRRQSSASSRRGFARDCAASAAP